MRQLLAICILVVSGISQAEYWVETTTKSVSVDTDSMLRKDALVMFWTRQLLPNGKITKIYHKADCDLLSDEYQQLQERNEDGSFHSISIPKETHYFPKDSYGGQVILTACALAGSVPEASLLMSPEAIRAHALKGGLVKLEVGEDKYGNVMFRVNSNRRLSLKLVPEKGKSVCILDFAENQRSMNQTIDPSTGGVLMLSIGSEVSLVPRWMAHEIGNGYIELAHRGGRFRWTRDDFQTHQSDLVTKIAKVLYANEIDALLITGGDNGGDSRNSAVGFSLLWDKAEEECGFPRLRPQPKSREKPSPPNKKKIM